MRLYLQLPGTCNDSDVQLHHIAQLFMHAGTVQQSSDPAGIYSLQEDYDAVAAMNDAWDLPDMPADDTLPHAGAATDASPATGSLPMTTTGAPDRRVDGGESTLIA